MKWNPMKFYFWGMAYGALAIGTAWGLIALGGCQPADTTTAPPAPPPPMVVTSANVWTHVGNDVALQVLEIASHQYLVGTIRAGSGGRGLSMVHAQSCPCLFQPKPAIEK